MGYFIGTHQDGSLNLFGVLRVSFLDLAVALLGVTVLIGIVNLVSVHVVKMQKGDGEFYSFVLVLSLVITLMVGGYDLMHTYFLGEAGLQGTLWIFNYVQLPIEMSLMALLAVSLTYAMVRLLKSKVTITKAVFTGVVFFVFLGMIPFVVSTFGILADFRMWVIQVLSLGGARGILLGVALGVIATGLRLLIGGDRPYGGG